MRWSALALMALLVPGCVAVDEDTDCAATLARKPSPDTPMVSWLQGPPRVVADRVVTALGYALVDDPEVYKEPGYRRVTWPIAPWSDFVYQQSGVQTIEQDGRVSSVTVWFGPGAMNRSEAESWLGDRLQALGDDIGAYRLHDPPATYVPTATFLRLTPVVQGLVVHEYILLHSSQHNGAASFTARVPGQPEPQVTLQEIEADARTFASCLAPEGRFFVVPGIAYESRIHLYDDGLSGGRYVWEARYEWGACEDKANRRLLFDAITGAFIASVPQPCIVPHYHQ